MSGRGSIARLILAPLPRADTARVQHLSLPAHQAEFVGTIAEMSAEPDLLQDFHEVRAGPDIIGFFKIDRDFSRRIPRLPGGALGLRGVLIGGQYQGKGHGRALLRALPGYLAQHYPDAPCAWLSVDAANTLATRLYKACGWRTDGPDIQGRCGAEHVLRLDLEGA